MSLREEYLAKNNGVEAAAAAGFATDLNRDNPSELKVGYTQANAILAAAEIFPEVTEIQIRLTNNWPN